MALNTVGNLITEVLVRNNRTTTDSFVTDTMLQDWTRDAHTWATSFKKWPCTEGRLQTTWAGVEEINFEGYKADSIRFVTVGGKVLQKLNFENYRKMQEITPGLTDRVYSDYGKINFFNVNADVSGTLVAYGQYQPVLDPTDYTAETVFSSWNAEANEAIVEKMTSYLKRREHLPDEAELHDQRASAKLEEVAKTINDEQYAYQNPAGDGMFKRFDVLRGGFAADIFKRDQFGG